MRRLVIFLAISLFLISFAVAISVTGGTVNNGSAASSIGNAHYTDTSNGSDSSEVSAGAPPSTSNNEGENIKNSIRSIITAASENSVFCGTSTLGSCQTDSDCIKGGCSSQVCQSKDEEPIITTCEYSNCYNSEAFKINCLCINNKCMWSRLTENQIKEITTARNRITFAGEIKQGECPVNCTCSGSTTSCNIANGRELTITAGNSGNVIIQVKGENMTTNVTLYRSDDGKIYGTFNGNQTKEIKMLPDQVKERIRENLSIQFENENISLDGNGTYHYMAEKKAKLFGIFNINVPVKAELDSSTGDITQLKIPWWSFLSKDDSSQLIVGASCGVVTPGQNDACCQSKGFDLWNPDTQQCEFSP